MRLSAVATLILALFLGLFAGSCDAPEDLVLYTSVDPAAVKSVIGLFEARNALRVTIVSEAPGESPLAERLLAERGKAGADIYWSAEPVHVIRLAESGVFAAFAPPGAADLPGWARDENARWTAVGYRTRIVGRSTRPEYRTLVKEVRTVMDMTAPALHNRVAFGTPTSATAAAHLAILYGQLGEEKYRALLLGLRAANVRLLRDDPLSAVASNLALVAVGDSSDLRRDTAGPRPALIEDASGDPILLPTTLSMVAGGHHPDNARKLLDFLCQKIVEDQLVALHYLDGSLRDPIPDSITRPDFQKAAADSPTATQIALTVLQDRAGK